MGWKDYNEDYGEEKPRWNQAELFCFSLNDLNREVDTCLRLQDLFGAYRLLRRIYSRIEYLILQTMDEYKDSKYPKAMFDVPYQETLQTLKKLFSDVHKLLNGNNSNLNQGQIDLKLDEISKLLYKFQWDMHLIFPKEVKRDWLAEIKADFE